MPARVRVDKRDACSLVEQIGERLRSEVASDRVDKAAGFDLLAAADDVRLAIDKAYPVPLTEQVRLSRPQASDLANALRASARLGA